MNNKRMQEKLEKDEAVDISECERLQNGDYILTTQWQGQGVDYCDKRIEAWIWSIGRLLVQRPVLMENGEERVLPVGTVLASHTTRYYSMGQSREVECVWLR